jgi:hypothetical protein
MQETHCDGCGQQTPSYDIVHYGSTERGYRSLCSRCFNSEVAKVSGLEKFEHIQFEPVVLTDSTGKTHEFHFRARLFGNVVVLDAFELLREYPSGYQFRVTGDPEEDPFALLGRLIEKMRRALSIQHVKEGAFELQIANLETVRGLIHWDDAGDGRAPMLVVDGREITWEEFGRMLMAFEGSQFKLEIRELSDDL